MRCLGARAHHDDHALRLGCANVVKQVIGAADGRGKFVHDRLDFFRARHVVRIAGFTRLEIDIRILGGAAQHGMIGRERALAMLEARDPC